MMLAEHIAPREVLNYLKAKYPERKYYNTNIERPGSENWSRLFDGLDLAYEVPSVFLRLAETINLALIPSDLMLPETRLTSEGIYEFVDERLADKFIDAVKNVAKQLIFAINEEVHKPASIITADALDFLKSTCEVEDKPRLAVLLSTSRAQCMHRLFEAVFMHIAGLQSRIKSLAPEHIRIVFCGLNMFFNHFISALNSGHMDAASISASLDSLTPKLKSYLLSSCLGQECVLSKTAYFELVPPRTLFVEAHKSLSANKKVLFDLHLANLAAKKSTFLEVADAYFSVLSLCSDLNGEEILLGLKQFNEILRYVKRNSDLNIETAQAVIMGLVKMQLSSMIKKPATAHNYIEFLNNYKKLKTKFPQYISLGLDHLIEEAVPMAQELKIAEEALASNNPKMLKAAKEVIKSNILKAISACSQPEQVVKLFELYQEAKYGVPHSPLKALMVEARFGVVTRCTRFQDIYQGQTLGTSSTDSHLVAAMKYRYTQLQKRTDKTTVPIANSGALLTIAKTPLASTNIIEAKARELTSFRRKPIYCSNTFIATTVILASMAMTAAAAPLALGIVGLSLVVGTAIAIKALVIGSMSAVAGYATTSLAFSGALVAEEKTPSTAAVLNR